jgi:PhoPQ-activated pathogenicity-related protein
MDLVFTSQNWHDSIWKHRARIYIPENYQKDGNVAIIGAHKDFSPEKNYFVGGVDGADLAQFNRGKILGQNNQPTELSTESEFCEGTAIDLGIPIMLFNTPGDIIFGLDESDLMGYGLKKLGETFDLTWFPYLPIVISYLRAITLLHSLPEVKAQRAVLFGNSKRGVSVSLATGVDPDRVAGIICTGAHGGNTLHMILMKFAQLGPDVGGPAIERAGPGFLPAERLLEILNSAAGFFLLMSFDPYIWRKQIKAAYMIAIGTNDEFTGLGAPDGMIKNMEGDKALLYIDNLPHTWTSLKHLSAWRMLISHTFYNRQIPSIEINKKVQNSHLYVNAKIDNFNEIKGVKLFYSFNKSSDWRFSQWELIPMNFEDGEYKAVLQIRKDMKLAYYVELEDYHNKGGIGYVSTPISFEGWN